MPQGVTSGYPKHRLALASWCARLGRLQRLRTVKWATRPPSWRTNWRAPTDFPEDPGKKPSWRTRLGFGRVPKTSRDFDQLLAHGCCTALGLTGRTTEPGPMKRTPKGATSSSRWRNRRRARMKARRTETIAV